MGLGYRGRWVRVEGYVDSGALYSLFRAEFATGLGIDVEKGEKVYLQGISGAVIPAYVHEIEIQLRGHRFKGMVAFSDKLGVSFNIIGRRSFFERFEVCFNDTSETVTLTPIPQGQSNPQQDRRGRAIPLAQPDIGDQEREAILKVLNTPYLSLGPKLEEFEERIAEYVGVKYAIATNSGTSALHLIIRALGIGEGAEVITTPFSFIASANCILFERARPIFVDIDPKTLNIDPERIVDKLARLHVGTNTKRKGVKAILAVDVFGHPADWDRLQKIAKEYNLKLIEDSAEALGALYKGQKAGSFGDAAVFGFYPNKQITSVRYDTPVMIKKDGKIRLVKIGELMDFMIDDYWKPQDYECLAFDKDGKISWQKINAFIKHKVNTEILKIQLEKGREVEITKSHSVFTIKDNEIKAVLGRDLKVGDYLVVPRRLPMPIKSTQEIDVLDYIDRENIKFNNDRVIIKSKGVGGGGKYIARKIKIDENFCKLLGYFAAEGGYESDKSGGLRFTFGISERNTYIKEVKNIFESIWPNFKVAIVEDRKTNKCSILCGGILHSELFRRLGCGKNVYDKNIPDIIWDTSDKNKLAFIEGLLNGDGHRRTISGSESRKITVASENLANGLHYLLLTLGIQSRLEKSSYYSKKGKLCHSYTCEILGFDKQMTSKENCIPKEFLSLNDKSSHLQRSRIKDKKSVSLKTVENWLNQKIDCPEFLLKDITVLKINKIEREKIHDFVYDFEVQGLQNFIGGYGAICLHNTGEGGAIVTSNKQIAKLCRSMRNQGRGEGEGEGWLQHERLGYNYRLSDINCALGLAQLERIEEILAKRERVAQMYNERLKDIEGINIPYVSPDVKLSWFVYVIRLDERFTQKQRDQILQELRKRGIGCGNYFSPIHLQPFYREMFGFKEGDFPVTEHVSARTIALPFYNNLREEEIDYVAENLESIIRSL